ncbi:MAG TPA: hypothetical protein VKT81_05845 [Bryobacteraceae bacterium]|nr:hypothetical protein [Bryobacteraceae bacterium]
MRRGAKLSSGLVLAALMLIGISHAAASPSVHRFLAYYEAVQDTNAPLDLWERVAASFVLTRAEHDQAPKSKLSATCSQTFSL